MKYSFVSIEKRVSICPEKDKTSSVEMRSGCEAQSGTLKWIGGAPMLNTATALCFVKYNRVLSLP